MLLDILQGEVVASGDRGGGGAGQEVSFYFEAMGMRTDGAHVFYSFEYIGLSAED
jgi:hypothetical protein